MGQPDREAFFIGATSAADATGKRGVYCIAITGAAQNFALPSSWSAARTDLGKLGTGPFIRVKFVGVAGQYAYSAGAAQALTLNNASAPGTGAVGTGWPLADGEVEDAEVPVGSSHFNFIGASAAGYLFVRLSEGGWA